MKNTTDPTDTTVTDPVTKPKSGESDGKTISFTSKLPTKTNSDKLLLGLLIGIPMGVLLFIVFICVCCKGKDGKWCCFSTETEQSSTPPSRPDTHVSTAAVETELGLSKKQTYKTTKSMKLD